MCGVVGDIVLHRRKVDRPIAEHIDIGNGRARALCARAHARDLLVQDLRHRTADRIVRPCRTARTDVEEFLPLHIGVAVASCEEHHHRRKDCPCRKNFLYGRNLHDPFLLPTSSNSSQNHPAIYGLCLYFITKKLIRARYELYDFCV